MPKTHRRQWTDCNEPGVIKFYAEWLCMKHTGQEKMRREALLQQEHAQQMRDLGLHYSKAIQDYALRSLEAQQAAAQKPDDVQAFRP